MLSKHIYNRYAMAGQYANFLTIVHRLFQRRRVDYRKAGGASGSPDSNTSDGGLDDYILLGIEEMHKHMGAHDDETFVAEVPEADLRLGSESDFESRRSETTSPNAVFKNEETPASTPASTGFTSVNNSCTSQGRARSESQLFLSTRDVPRTSDASANGASYNSSASHNAAHDSDWWKSRSPTVGAAAVTAIATTAQHTWDPESLSSLQQHPRPEYSQAIGTGCHPSTPQSQYTVARTPSHHSAYLAQLKRQGAVSVQNDDLLALKDSESGDVDPQDFDDTNSQWVFWDYSFGQNREGCDGSVTLDQQCSNLDRYSYQF